MDWPFAIELHRSALLRIVAELIAMVGSLTIVRLPRAVHTAVLAILRPAESAVRRLIIAAAHGVVVKPCPARAFPREIKRTAAAARAPRFQLFDTRKRFAANRRRYFKPGAGPRITFFPVDDDPRIPLFRPPVPDAITIEISLARDPAEAVPAQGLCRRLAAINAALADLPKQALRLARWRARRAAMKEAKFRDPCRPGPPPGHRRRQTREIDHILKDCHWLAWEAERVAPNTS